MNETPETRAKLAEAIRTLQAKGDTQTIESLVSAYKTKYQTAPIAPLPLSPEKQGVVGTLLNPIKEGFAGLKTLYGGGEQGIARKLATNVQEASADIQKGNVVKGVTKAGFRTAGDVAGTVYAPIGAVVGATGIDKVFSYLGELSQRGGKYNPINAITDSKAIQDFVANRPNLEEDFGRALNLAFAAAEKGTIDPKTVVPRTIAQVQSGVGTVKSVAGETAANLEAAAVGVKNKVSNADIFKKDVATLRAEKVSSGYAEQNARLKSAEKAFNKNTKTITNPDGTKTKVTPIDTLAKYDIAPDVQKGTIQMGDYQQKTGALGKIRENVSSLDAQLETTLASSKKVVPIDSFMEKAIARVKADGDLIRAGKVTATVNKLESVFNDYKKSYGKNLPVQEVNSIRKTMNKDFSPDTVDVSRVVGDVARDIVYKADKAAQPLLAEQGSLLAAKKYAEAINNTKVTGGKLGNYAMRTAGAVIGSTVEKAPVVGPVLGMIGGEYLARAMQQTQFKSIGAEAKAILQRSNKYQPSQSANAIPNKVITPSITKLSPEVQRILNVKGIKVPTTLETATAQIKQSGAFPIEKSIANGDIPRASVYKGKGDTLNPSFAQGRIDDVAQKLDMHSTGLGDAYRATISAENTTMADIINKGLKFLQGK
jgi:hypothetical protein